MEILWRVEKYVKFRSRIKVGQEIVLGFRENFYRGARSCTEFTHESRTSDFRTGRRSSKIEKLREVGKLYNREGRLIGIHKGGEDLENRRERSGG